MFIYGLVGPLLRAPRLGYVKGYYRRPVQVWSRRYESGGGRVTELTARPLLNLFFPELSGVIQPLAGESAGRREVLEHLPFFTGYGVEIGLLIDVLERFGLGRIAQVNLGARVHRNRDLPSLSIMAFAVAQVLMTRAGGAAGAPIAGRLPSTMRLVSLENGMALEPHDVREHERPPIATVPAYRERRRLTHAPAAATPRERRGPGPRARVRRPGHHPRSAGRGVPALRGPRPGGGHRAGGRRRRDRRAGVDPDHPDPQVLRRAAHDPQRRHHPDRESQPRLRGRRRPGHDPVHAGCGRRARGASGRGTGVGRRGRRQAGRAHVDGVVELRDFGAVLQLSV